MGKDRLSSRLPKVSESDVHKYEFDKHFSWMALNVDTPMVGYLNSTSAHGHAHAHASSPMSAMTAKANRLATAGGIPTLNSLFGTQSTFTLNCCNDPSHQHKRGSNSNTQITASGVGNLNNS
jgi:hypothetical protein